jgi:hypothetical protein
VVRICPRKSLLPGVHYSEQYLKIRPVSALAVACVRVVDPHWFTADPEMDPDPAFFLIADPDSDPNADPDPVPDPGF